MDGFNKTIWLTWFQGWDNAPEIAERCLDSWRHYNPDWNIVLLDDTNYKDYCKIDKVLPGLQTNNISLGDILRLFLLKEHGGVWADATLFCNKPLDKWIYDIDDSFVFTRSDKMIASWFVAAKKNSVIVNDWYEEMVKFWTYRIEETDQFEQQYGWIHALFRHCHARHPEFKRIVNDWDKIDCTSDGNSRGNGPHLFAPYREYFYKPISEEIARRIDSKVDPVYKLSYKAGTDWRAPEARGIHPTDQKIMMDYPTNSELHYLLNTIK